MDEYYKQNYRRLHDIYTKIGGLKINHKPMGGSIGQLAFLSEDIKRITKKNGFEYSCKYENVEIKLKIFYKLIDPTIIMKRLITFCKFLKGEKNEEHIVITIWPTSKKKRLPKTGETITNEHVNSGCTYVSTTTGVDGNNSEIFIWRKEELLKVLLHECIHAFGVDHQLIWNGEIYKCKVLNKFCVDDKYVTVNEVYAELMATIYNGMFVLLEGGKMGNEQKHSLIQMSKILNHYGYKSFDQLLRDNDCKKFKQKTNVLSYYIIKGCYLHHPEELVKFLTKGEFNLDNVCVGIKMTKISDGNSLRMTISETIPF